MKEFAVKNPWKVFFLGIFAMLSTIGLVDVVLNGKEMYETYTEVTKMINTYMQLHCGPKA